MLAWLDQATVDRAEGVTIRRAGQNRFTNLSRGETLREGDLLAIRPDSSFLVTSTSGRKLGTSRGDAPKHASARLMLVTGQRTLALRTVPKLAKDVPRVPQQTINRIIKQGWGQYGEAGRPLKPEERRGFHGFEEEINQQKRK
jgi:hypothetical protein